MSTLEDTAILISLTLTIPLLGISAGVLDEWMPSLLHRDCRTCRWTATDWLVLGICFSFAGSIGDNIWWGIAWMNRYFRESTWEWWFDNGVFSNIIFRQACKLIAGYCHLRAAVETGAMTRLTLSTRVAILWLLAAIALLALVLNQP